MCVCTTFDVYQGIKFWFYLFFPFFSFFFSPKFLHSLSLSLNSSFISLSLSHFNLDPLLSSSYALLFGCCCSSITPSWWWGMEKKDGEQNTHNVSFFFFLLLSYFCLLFLFLSLYNFFFLLLLFPWVWEGKKVGGKKVAKWKLKLLILKFRIGDRIGKIPGIIFSGSKYLGKYARYLLSKFCFQP